jgi:hypothetical protein
MGKSSNYSTYVFTSMLLDERSLVLSLQQQNTGYYQKLSLLFGMSPSDILVYRYIADELVHLKLYIYCSLVEMVMSMNLMTR